MIQSVKKAMDILTVLSENSDEPIMLSELAEKTGLNKSTCAHIVDTLCESFYVERVSRKEGYRLGPWAYMLSRYGGYHRPLIKISSSVLKWLRKQTGATVFISVLCNGRKFIVYHIDDAGILPMSDGSIIQGYIETTGIIANCASGVTGAGRKPAQNSHYPELNEGMSAYKVACHRHTPEIEQTLSKISGEKMHITFVPHLLPVNRGILATCYAKLKPGVTEEMLRAAYEERYDKEPFVRLLPKGKSADIHNIKYTNFCDVSIFTDPRTGTFIAGRFTPDGLETLVSLGTCEPEFTLTENQLTFLRETADLWERADHQDFFNSAYAALRAKNVSIAQCFSDDSFREEPYWMEIYAMRIITARTGALVPGGKEMTCIFAVERNYQYPCFVIVPGSVDRLSRWNSFHVYAVPIAVSPYINTLGEEKECLVLLAGDIYTGM